MAQVISAVQRKGGACKSTMLQCIAAHLGGEGAKVLIIDTDPQGSCVEWASEQDIKGVDILPHLDEDTLFDIIDKVDANYDCILIDTAGFDSRMAGYVIQASDLILIPTGGSKTSLMGAARTWKHASDTTKRHANPPQIRMVFWGVKQNSSVFKAAEQSIKSADMPVIKAHVGNYVGFEAMSWNGGLPTGVAKMALSSFMAQVQIDGLIDFYNEKYGVKHGQAA